MDEKWKLGKKGSRNASSGSNTSMMRCGSIGGGRGGGGESSVLKRSDSVPARSKFSSKCASVVKEKRAKFYIVRRCVTMLVCWKDYRDS